MNGWLGRRSPAGRLIAATCIGGSCCLLAACGSNDTSSTAASGPAATQSSHAGKKVAIVIPDPSGAYHQMACGARIEGQRLGVDVGDAQAPSTAFDVAGEARALQSVLASRPSGLIYTPADAKAGAIGVKPAATGGIPVANVDAKLDDPSLYASFVGSDGVAGAKTGGELLAKQIGGSGKVAAVGILPDNPITVARITGFQEAMKAYPDIKVLPVLYPEVDANKIAAAATALLTKNPDIKAFYTTNGDLIAPAVATALRGARQDAKVKLVTWDLQAPTIKLLQSGTVTGSVVQQPREWGRLALRQLVAEFDGKAVEKDVTVPTLTVTGDTIDDPATKKLYYTADC